MTALPPYCARRFSWTAAQIAVLGATVAPFSNRAAVLRRARLQTAQPWHPASRILCRRRGGIT